MGDESGLRSNWKEHGAYQTSRWFELRKTGSVRYGLGNYNTCNRDAGDDVPK